MLTVLVAMVLVMGVAGLVLVYVAYPHRGQEVPHVPQVGRALNRAVDSLPVLDPVDSGK